MTKLIPLALLALSLGCAGTIAQLGPVEVRGGINPIDVSFLTVEANTCDALRAIPFVSNWLGNICPPVVPPQP